MPRVNSYSISYKLRYKIKFDAPIMFIKKYGTQKGDTLHCRKDNRPEALEFDKHAVGVFKEDILVSNQLG